MYGKWHLGEGEETWPHSQGFDEALCWAFTTRLPGRGIRPAERIMWNNYADTPEFFTRYKLLGKMEARKGEKAREVAPLNKEVYTTFEEETFMRSIDFIKRNADGEKPFFLYWASNLMSQFTSHPDWEGKVTPGDT